MHVIIYLWIEGPGTSQYDKKKSIVFQIVKFLNTNSCIVHDNQSGNRYSHNCLSDHYYYACLWIRECYTVGNVNTLDEKDY